jgi:hypothetical protein
MGVSWRFTIAPNSSPLGIPETAPTFQRQDDRKNPAFMGVWRLSLDCQGGDRFPQLSRPDHNGE